MASLGRIVHVTDDEYKERLIKLECKTENLEKDIYTIKRFSKWIIGLLVGIKTSMATLIAKGFNWI